ncbi:flavoprotein-like protein [Aspergillus karnatakaensis]|uniref:flavin-dependent quinone reductase n=1 Tax=Aspergillus karnatakaensis TaxID=1810916 RepID=UPI003CCE4D76
MPPSNLAIITCSTREPRLNPYITDYIHSILLQETAHYPSVDKLTLTIIDLASQNLPLYNEPAIPSHLPASDPTPHYTHAHTRAWSTLIQQYDGFIFVTPQYNWSIPAALKNALDYLFYEWKGKVAGIVTYGGRGGGKAGEHLQQILTGLRMKPVAMRPGIVVGSAALESCAADGGFQEEDLERWRVCGVEEEVRGMIKEMLNEG